MGLMDDIRGALGAAALRAHDRLTKAEPSPSSAPSPAGAKPAQEAQSLTIDPFWLIDQFGYRDKPTSMTYDTLKQMPLRVPILGAMLKTRIDQVTEFAVPQASQHDIGFVCCPVDKEAKLSPADKKFAGHLRDSMIRGSFADGWPGYEESFQAFVKMVIADSMILDQACFEVIPDRMGRPSTWMSVDSGSIRLADTLSLQPQPAWDRRSIRTVQVFAGDVVNEYTRERMAFGIRNPRSDMRLRGYGQSESEMMTHTLSQIMFADAYNSKAFTQGISTEGILHMKGEGAKGEGFNEFRAAMYARLTGINNARTMPIVRSADSLEFINLHLNAKDMAFPEYYDFLIKIAAAYVGMDPTEINFKYGNAGGGKSVFEEGNKDRLAASKARGLKPLLKFLGELLTRMLIAPHDPDWCIRFVGLESSTPGEQADLIKKKISSTLTINEARREQGLPEIKGGDIIESQVFLQRIQGLEAAEQAEQAGPSEDGEAPGQAPAPGSGAADGGEDIESDQDADKEAAEAMDKLMGGGKPKKAADQDEPKAMQKSLPNGKVMIEVEL